MVEKIQVVNIETVVPQLVRVNEIIEKVVEKIVPVTVYEEVPVEVKVIEEKVVQVAVTRVDKQPVEVVREKVTEVSKMVKTENVVNRIEKEVQLVDRVEKSQVPVYTTVEKIVEIPQIQEKIVERIVILPQIVEVLKYVHEIAETDSLGLAVGVDIVEQERRYKEIYGVARNQLTVFLAELKRLRSSSPALAGQIDLLEKYLLDFDRLAAVQRIVAVDREKIVEKDVTRPVLVPTKDSETVRNELALSLLAEKLIAEIKRIKRENPTVGLKLDSDVGLVFFPELFDKQNIAAGSFEASLRNYTLKATEKLQKIGGGWSADHELILSTVLADRFVYANLVRQANIEIEKAKGISDSRATTLREREDQLQHANKLLGDTQRALRDLLANNPTYSGNATITKLADNINTYLVSGLGANYNEPLRIISEFVGSGNNWDRLASHLREREAELVLLRSRIIDIEKANLKVAYSGVDTERTLASLRAENANLVKEIDRLKSSASIASNSANREKELELKLRTANARIQELESQLRTAELKLRDVKDSKSSATSSVLENNAHLVFSQYSSLSSTEQAKKTYETPSYGVNSSYSESSVTSSEGKSTPSYVQQTTSNIYTGNTTGTTGYQIGSKLTSSGRDPTTTTSYGTTNVSPSATTTYGTSGTTGLYGSRTSGTTYGTTATSGTTYGATSGSSTGYSIGATGTATYGASSGSSSSYGATGATYTSESSGSGYTTSYGIGNTGATTYGATSGTGLGSSLSSSGLRQSGSSGYQFQTKKY